MKSMKKTIKKIRGGWLRELAGELRFIYGYAVQHRFEVLLYMLIGVLSTAMSLGAALLSKHIIDAVTGKDTNAIIPAAFFYLTMHILSIAFNAFSSRINARIQLKVEQDIRADVYDSITSSSWLSLGAYRSGDLLSRLESDVSVVSKSVLGWLCDIVTKLIRFIGALAIILYYDPPLALISLLAVPFSVLLSQLLLRKLRTFSVEMRKAAAELTSFSEESFAKISEIKSLGLSEAYRQKLRQQQDNYKQKYLKYVSFSVSLTAFMSVIGTAVAGACFLWCAWRLWEGVITFGTMTLFLQMSGTLSGSFSAILSTIPSAVTSAACAGRIKAIMSLEKENTEDSQKAQELIDKGNITVEAKGVSFSYDSSATVFENTGFIAKPGDIVGIVGASGEGKTTFLRMLLGLVSITGGSLCVSSCDSQKINISAGTRKLFSYVGQENIMFNTTVRENMLIVCPEASDKQIIYALKSACAYDFVASKPEGLDTVIGDSSKSFSQGQLQRLSIARAILCNRPIMLLDEATSALDEKTERMLIESLADCASSRTIIVATHRPGILKLCNKVYRIENSRLTLQ